MNNYYFVSIDENNIIDDIQIVSFDNCQIDGIFNEQKGEEFCIANFGRSKWIATYRDGSKRKNYAGVGYSYDDINDVFISPKPAEDAYLNEEFEWEIPNEFDLIDVEDLIYNEDYIINDQDNSIDNNTQNPI